MTDTVLRPSLIALLLVGLAGCDGCGSKATPASPSSTASTSLPPPVPAPEGLMGTFVVPSPDDTLGQVRSASGASLLLPRTVGGLVANLFGLPIAVAELMDERLPVRGAFRHTGTGEQAAVAFHVRDAARLVTFVAQGSDPAYDANRDGDRTWLVPREASREPRLGATLVLLDHHLVAATDRDAALALGPYLTRTLAREEAPEGDVVVSTTAAAGPALGTARERLRAIAGRIPMPPAVAAFVDPASTAERVAALFADVGPGTLTLHFGPQALTIDGTFATTVEKPPSAGAAQLLAFPDDVIAVAHWSDAEDEDPADRAAQLRDSIDPSWSEGAALAEPALKSLGEGMGAEITMALRCTGVGFTGAARGSVDDGDALREGLGALAALREEEAVEKRLEAAKLRLSFEERRLRHVPFDVFRLRLEPADEEARKKPDAEVDFLYGVGDDHWVAAAGRETVATVQRFEKPDPERSLATRPSWKAALDRLPSPAWATVVIDAQGLHACSLGKPGGTFVTPIAFGVGPDGEAKLRVRLEVARPLLKLAAEAAGGF